MNLTLHTLKPSTQFQTRSEEKSTRTLIIDRLTLGRPRFAQARVDQLPQLYPLQVDEQIDDGVVTLELRARDWWIYCLHKASTIASMLVDSPLLPNQYYMLYSPFVLWPLPGKSNSRSGCVETPRTCFYDHIGLVREGDLSRCNADATYEHRTLRSKIRAIFRDCWSGHAGCSMATHSWYHRGLRPKEMDKTPNYASLPSVLSIFSSLTSNSNLASITISIIFISSTMTARS
ncbi:hypothetical protein BT96DRAFT_994528 [Gymnopus androsaceus JB14]|uniref:Uncharacterized protein n=1 Tax=Gymnopus androsaceus JB14 TaxID=1447944 RepID=A0A6A4HP58_9AGAR|nr:hypothetical protein BT96DRAFT_994528 [Gymnopus androsaceus JB14]